jgi:FtsZ-interacting cell division protein ZipA
MSDLQVVLIVLGSFIIAAVVIYNWMQERKLRNEVAGDFIVPHKDVLADDFHIDADAYMIDRELAEVTEKIKHFADTAPARSLSETVAIEPIESRLSAPFVSETAPPSTKLQDSEFKEAGLQQPTEAADVQYVTQKEIKAELREETPSEPIVQATLYDKTRHIPVSLPEITHPQIDLTAILYLTKPISSNELSALISPIAGIGLPIAFHGLDSQDKWHLLNDGAATLFKQVACSLQLVDRGGSVTKNLLNKFQFAAENAGIELNAHVEWQGSGDAMQRAIELDQFCIEVDQLISVHVMQNEVPIHGTKFKGLAEASGMTLKEDGKFHFYANETLLFTATDANNLPFAAESLRSSVLKGVTFQIEIPKVNNCEQVFNQMIVIAKKMASSLNASLEDDNQKQLGDLQIEKIRQQLKVIHATMVARGILPGSPASMRLFN